MQFNKPIKILAESFNYKEKVVSNDQGEQEKKIKLTGLALTLGKATRNGVIYSLQDDSILNTMVGKPFLDTHNDDSCLNTFGKVDRFWREGNDLMYEVEVDPEEKNFIRKVRNKFIPGCSVQILCNTAEEDNDGNIHANIESFLELSAVTIPGEGDSTATLLEAFGKKNPRTILKVGQETHKGDTVMKVKTMKEQAEGDGRPDKVWWKKCIDKASGFADDPEAFCGALYYDPEKFKGGSSMKKAYGEELLNELTEEFVRNNFGAKEDLTTSDGSGGALIGDTLPKKKKEFGPLAAAGAGMLAGQILGKDGSEEEKCGKEERIPKKKKEIGPLAAAGAGMIAGQILDKEERIYDPKKAADVTPNYDKEKELEDTLDNIQDTGKSAEPEGKRNLIPNTKMAKAEMVSRKLTEINNRIKKIEVRQRIEKINRKLEGIKNAKVKKKRTGTI